MRLAASFIALTFLAIVLALPPEEAFRDKLLNNISDKRITYTKMDPIPTCGKEGVRCIRSAPGVLTNDLSYYIINSSKADCNGKWKSKGAKGKMHYSGDCVSDEPVAFYVPCSRTKNQKGERNWLAVYFNEDNDTKFKAFGDAQARFVQGDKVQEFTDQANTTVKNPIVEVLCPRR